MNQPNLLLTLTRLHIDSEYARGALEMLSLLGLARLEDGRATPTGTVAEMAIGSLRAHLIDGVTVGLDWDDLDSAGVRGVDILRAIESTRMDRVSHPEPGRIVYAAQAIIKTQSPDSGEDLYLMQYDPHAGRYQPIGGKQEPDENDLADTLRREIQEELGLDAPLHPGQCSLSLLGDGWIETTLSATYGILTRYTFSFYHVQAIRFPIRIDGDTRWLTRDEIAAGHADDGRPITPIYQQALGWDRLDSLPAEILPG